MVCLVKAMVFLAVTCGCESWTIKKAEWRRIDAFECGVGEDSWESWGSSPSLPPSIFPSIRVFSTVSALPIRWPKYWSFSFSISPSNEYSGLISFRIDWFDILAGQGTLKSLLHHHSLKASFLWRSAFFMVQLSHPYTTLGKTIDLTRWNFLGKVMSLLFNTLSRFVIAFIPRRKH